jgi:hypothetical protein
MLRAWYGHNSLPTADKWTEIGDLTLTEICFGSGFEACKGPPMSSRHLLLPILLIGFVGIAGCNDGDWRQNAINAAEAKMRTELSDPSAAFSRVQITGDSSTGQTCGYVEAKTGPSADKTGRFIVYVDGAGPFVEHHMGLKAMTQERFDFAWEYDCVKEGYKS